MNDELINKYNLDNAKILIVKLDHIGDMVLTTPSIEAIKKRYPKCYLAIMCSPVSASVLNGNPYVDKIYVYRSPMFDRDNSLSVMDYAQNFGVLLEVRQAGFDLVIDFRGDLSNIPLSKLCGAKSILSYSNNSHFSGFLHVSTKKLDDKHESQNQFQLLKLIDIPEPPLMNDELINKYNLDNAKILIVKLDHIGDMVLTTPSIEAIKKRYPKCYLAIMCSPVSASVLNGNPYVDKIYVYRSPMFDRDNSLSVMDYAQNFGVLLEVRQAGFDLVIDFRGDLSNIPLSKLCGAKSILSYSNNSHFSGFLHVSTKKLDDKHESQNQFQLLKLIDIPEPPLIQPQLYIDSDAIVWSVDYLRKNGISENSKIIVINPGGGWYLNWWPWKNFALLCDQISRDYPEIKIILVGGAKERVVAEKIMKSTKGPIYSAVGETDLMQLSALISRALFMVTNDGGPMHVASAVNTPVVALFGPSPHERFGPLGKDNLIISKNYPCSPCPQFVKGQTPGCSDNHCMQAITVSEVFEKVKIMFRTKRVTRISCKTINEK